jgi:hypothetical protein
MTATMPGINTTLVDTFSALETSRDAFGDRIVIIGRTSSGANPTYAHTMEARHFTSLQDVATAHGVTSELYEAFYHAQYAGCTDIWLLPLSATVAEDRSDDLNDAYETLYAIRPSIIVPYGRGAKIDIDAAGVVTRTVPVFGDSPGTTDGVYAESTIDYLEDLATACAALSSAERICIGILGVEALSDITPTGLITAIGTEAAPGTLLASLPDVDSFETPANGKYVNVIATEVETAGMGPWAWRRGQTTSYYRSNGALNYAGLITRLQVPDAPTNKVISGISNVGWRLSRNQTLACISKNVVTFNVNNGICRVSDSPTYAEVGSDYQRLSTVRIMGVVDNMVRSIGDTFIGKGMRLETRNSFHTALSSGFDNLMSAGILLEADFRVRFDGPNYTAYVDAIVVPAWELRRIEFSVRVTFQGINAPMV